MLRLILRKSLRSIALLVCAVLVTFLLMHAIPGSPWENYAPTLRSSVRGAEFDALTQRNLERHFGLDLPLWRQFTRYLLGDINPDGSLSCGAICGNLGPSTRQRGRTVQEVLFAAPEGRSRWESRFGYSIRLVLLAAVFAVGLGVPLGLLGAARPRASLARSASFGLAALIAIPNFVLGLLLTILLASWLKLIKVLPDWNDPTYWFIAAAVLAVMPMASIARVTQATLRSVLGEEYIRTARAKGLSQRRVMLVHVLRSALAPIITYLSIILMELFTGLLIIESLYSFPGFGREFWASVLAMDYPMVLGLTLLYAAGIILANLFTEIACAILDPRLRSPNPDAPR